METAQVEPQQNIPQPSPSPEITQQMPPPPFPIKKFLPFIVIGIVVLLLLSGVLGLGSRKSSQNNSIPTPTIRPTATPIIVPTLPEASPTVSQATQSATEKIKNKLVFIRDGDIYESDLFSYTLLVKNKTAAGDKLLWSPKGSFLSWRAKSTTGIQNTLTIFDRSKKTSFDATPSSERQGAELIDYAWSPDERQLTLVYRQAAYDIVLTSASVSGSVQQTKLVNKNTAVKQILWPKENIMVFSGEDGISSLNVSNIASVSARLIVSNKNIQNIKLSPVGNKILYSVAAGGRSDLYLVNTDGNFNQLLKADKNKADMDSSGIPANVVDGGFVSSAIFFPKGDRLMVGFNYMEGLPAVGIYDLKDNSFKAITSFSLSKDDVLIHDLLLLGPRLNISALQNTWQVSLFTMEADSKLGMIRAIPGATSPSYFGTYEDE